MSDLSPNHLQLVGYHTWSVERQVAYEAKLKEIGYVIGPPQMERVGRRQLGRSYALTDADLYGE